MPNYRRWFVPGGTYFFTAVTRHRRPLLTSEQALPVLKRAIQEEVNRRPFALNAIVLLPDHLHTIWTLPDEDTAYPIRWKCLKERFTREYSALSTPA